ncbi:GNAT family N-acetyltransferase, partial [Xanthomonas oryzae pv. oryzae]
DDWTVYRLDGERLVAFATGS